MSTKEELYEKAQELDIEGRSTMSKDELEEAVEGSDEGLANNERVGSENYAIEAEKEEPDFSSVAPETVSTTLGNLHGGVLPRDGKIVSPMEDPVGTAVTHRDELREEMAAKQGAHDERRAKITDERVAAEKENDAYSDADKAIRAQLGLAGITTTLNGERAASGDPQTTWEEVWRNRAKAGEPVNIPDIAKDEDSKS